MSDPDARTLPAPARLPREVAAHPDAPTPIPRRSSLEELRASEEPWVIALDELEARVIKAIADSSRRHDELEARTSGTDHEHAKKIADHETRMQRIEEASGAAASGTATLVRALTGRVHPKVLGAFVALGMLANFVLEVLRLVRGNR